VSLSAWFQLECGLHLLFHAEEMHDIRCKRVPVEVVVEVTPFMFNHLFEPFIIALLSEVALDPLEAGRVNE
jgi:hypothetical protein